jgi:nitrate/nitrite transporter NarK
MNNSSQTAAPSGNTLQLVLATGAFAICFAVFGSVSAMMPILKKSLGLDPVQVSIAMAIYLPTFLTEIFKLTPGDAGFRTAGFVVLATAMRPVGGMLADRIGGRKILLWVFPVTAAMAVFLACPMMVTFTIGALGMAAAIGLGNGAVFKLVPEYFPQSVGAVTWLVGAAGGLGGFFPPLVLGAVRQATGSFTPGFVLLALFAIICFVAVFKSGTKPGAKKHLVSHGAAA